MALVKVTEELLEDASGLDSYLRYWTPIKMQARLNTAVVRGNGVGKPLGIIGEQGDVPGRGDHHLSEYQ
jgi:HK97 family phage major capsid protein